MKKLLLAVLLLVLPVVNLYAMGGIQKDKPVIVDVLTADNPAWAGVKYSGNPVRTGPDAIGANTNYIIQVATIPNANGSTVQILLKGMAPVAYTKALSKLDATGSALGLTEITFQDSGIVMPRGTYRSKMVTPNTLNWSWQIILVYELDSDQTSAFQAGITPWVAGKLPFSVSGANGQNYYWKQ